MPNVCGDPSPPSPAGSPWRHLRDHRRPRPGVPLIYTTEHHDPHSGCSPPAADDHDPAGHKGGLPGGLRFRYDPEHYPDDDLAAALRVRMLRLPRSPGFLGGDRRESGAAGLLLEMGTRHPPWREPGRRAASTGPLSRTMLCAVERLIDVMDKPHAGCWGPR